MSNREKAKKSVSDKAAHKQSAHVDKPSLGDTVNIEVKGKVLKKCDIGLNSQITLTAR